MWALLTAVQPLKAILLEMAAECQFLGKVAISEGFEGIWTWDLVSVGYKYYIALSCSLFVIQEGDDLVENCVPEEALPRPGPVELGASLVEDVMNHLRMMDDGILWKASVYC